MPAAIGASGPTTTKSTALDLQKSITAAWSAMSSATHSASRAIPALPGAHQSLVSSGEGRRPPPQTGGRAAEPRAFGFPRDTGIARRAPEFGQQRRGRDLPRQSVFAAAGTEQKNVHGM